MKPYVLFFNARNKANVRGATWHPTTPDPPVDWGVFCTQSCDYICLGRIWIYVAFVPHSEGLEDARSMAYAERAHYTFETSIDAWHAGNWSWVELLAGTVAPDTFKADGGL